MDFLKHIPLHPYLLAGYSVLTLVALNMGKFAPWMAVRSLVFFILVIAILYWPLKWLTHSPYKAALLLTLFLAAFFTYGHIHNLLDGVRLVGINFGRHRTLLLIWAVILVAGVIWIALTRRDLQGVTQALNVILIIALCFPIFQITRYKIQSLLNSTRTVKTETGDLSTRYLPLAVPTGQQPPDIYYMQAMGFYVARCSQSNYATTELSLASSLNLNYLDVLGNNSKQIYTHPELYRLIQENDTRQLLENAGYRVVAFDSGFSPTDWKDADEYLARENEPLKTYLLGGINSFESLELQTSAGLLLYADNIALPKTLRSFLDGAFTEHRERILYAFNQLVTVPQMPGSKFVFVHILAPHSPFVFGAKGEIVGRSSPFTLNNDLEIADPKLYIQGYRNQIQYINRRTLQMLHEIIAVSQTPPIIILQGDHGPKAGIASQSGRMEILSAYYLPGGGDTLYATITPVNSFRLIFNQYFGGQFELLPDISFFSTYQKPDVFTVYQNDPASCTP
jgi:hypothetical protein